MPQHYWTKPDGLFGIITLTCGSKIYLTDPCQMMTILTHSLNFTHKDLDLVSFLANFEANNLSNDIQEYIRQRLIPNIQQSKHNKTFNQKEKTVLRKLRQEKSIVILSEDTGTLTMTMNKTDYINKAEDLLNDTNTYQIMNNNLIKQLGNKKTLKKMKNGRK